MGCFVLLLSLSDIVVDALAILLTIGAAVGVALLRDLELARAEGNGWQTQVQLHLAGLRDGMDQQFAQWGITEAEREVGLLILKGLNHKEIAALRATAEATVRQQAQAIYRKASLPGKTAFCAYFLEDLFAPEPIADELAGGGRARAV